MQLHTLRQQNTNKTKKRIGRGGKRGTYSGKGMKGQKSRAGRKLRPEIRDVIKKIPKKRGEHGRKMHSFGQKPAVINVGKLNTLDVDHITPQILVEKKIVNTKGGSIPAVKILGNGDVTKKLDISGCLLSYAAKEKIEKAGGKIEV